MSDPLEHKEHLADCWLSNWERQCENELENETDLLEQLESERNLAKQKMWYLFQNSATAVAQLLKDRNQTSVVWVPFQTAAGSLTTLYKESAEQVRYLSDLSFQAGYQRRTRELLAWAKKRRRHVMRDELISFLAGKTAPSSASQHSSRQRGPSRAHGCVESPPAHLSSSAETPPSSEADFQTFREALNLSSSSGRRRGSPVHCGNDLSAFVASEYARHKRPAPSSPTHDVVMDSPTHKRSRFM